MEMYQSENINFISSKRKLPGTAVIAILHKGCMCHSLNEVNYIPPYKNLESEIKDKEY